MNAWELFGFVRQEEERCFFRNLAGEEGLAYDFSVHPGDTVLINNPFGPLPVKAIVTNIDSVFISPANELRKRITLLEYQYYYNLEFWIEGMGSLAGLTSSGTDLMMITGGDDYSLLCYYESDDLMYKSPFYPLCYYPVVGTQETNKSTVKFDLFPNPVSSVSTLRIQNPDKKLYTIRFLDICGRTLKKYVISTSSEIEILAADFEKGMYFYSVMEDNKLVFCKKFIIQ